MKKINKGFKTVRVFEGYYFFIYKQRVKVKRVDRGSGKMWNNEKEKNEELERIKDIYKRHFKGEKGCLYFGVWRWCWNADKCGTAICAPKCHVEKSKTTSCSCSCRPPSRPKKTRQEKNNQAEKEAAWLKPGVSKPVNSKVVDMEESTKNAIVKFEAYEKAGNIIECPLCGAVSEN